MIPPHMSVMFDCCSMELCMWRCQVVYVFSYGSLLFRPVRIGDFGCRLIVSQNMFTINLFGAYIYVGGCCSLVDIGFSFY